MEQEEKIKVKDEDVLDFYDEFGSKHFQLQSKTLGDFGNKKLDIYFKSIELVTPITTAVGVIAGFGFTAYSYVQSKMLFFLGEGILVYSILNGLLWLQKIYKSEYNSLDNFINKQQEYYKKRNTAFMVVYEQLISKSHEILKKDMDNLLEINKEALDIFKPTEKPTSQIYSKEIYYCFVIGVIILFTSFFISNIQHYLCWFL